MSNAMRSEEGYTLTELAVATAIGAVLMTLAIPTFRTTMQHFSVSGAARELSNELRLVQGLAVKENTPHQIDFDDDAETYVLKREDGTTIRTKQLSTPGDRGMGAIDLVAVLDSNGADVTTIKYGRNGTVIIPAAAFPITATLEATSGERFQVFIHRAGRVETASL